MTPSDSPQNAALAALASVYAIAFANMDQGFCLLEKVDTSPNQPSDFRYLTVNPAFEKHTGLDNVTGKTILDVVPQAEQDTMAIYDQVALTGQSTHFQTYVGQLDLWMEARVYQLNQQPPQLAVLFNNITEWKKAQRQQSFLLALSDSLRPLTDPVTIQTIAAQQLLAELRAGWVYYISLATDSDTISALEGVSTEEPVPLLLGTGISRFGKAFLADYTNNGTVRYGDTQAEPSFTEQDRQAFRMIRAGALIAVPLVKVDKLIALLSVASPTPRVWTQQEVDLVKQVAERTWIALERARAEEALRKSEAAFRIIAQAAPALVWVCSALGEIIYFNQRWYDYTGQTEEQASGHGWITTMHPADAARILPYWQRCQRTGDSYEGEVRYQRHDGVYRWHLFRALPRRNSAGQIEAWYGLSIDTDDAKQAQEGLRKASRQKDEFLAMLAHELRNPMAAIHSGLAILSLTLVDEIPRSTVDMMSRQTAHLVRMVDDLLDVNRISQGKIELKTERANLVDLVQQAQHSLKALFEQQGKVLGVSLPTAPIEVDGDATRLTQVVINLLTNGLRYTGEGGQVRVSLMQEDNEAILQVRDNGIGLAEDQLEAIFELFVQVDNSLARSKGGLGLGLTLVKQLVGMHGGRVEAQSEGVGRGSTFTVRLPTLAAAPQPLAPPAQQAPDSGTPRRILVIDDNADAAMTLGMLLKLKGYESHTRTSGRSGLEAAEALQPAVILLDIGMPDLDGFASCRLIREQSWGGAVVVIALSGYGQQEDRQQTKEAGFDGHLVKPVDVEELLNMLTDLLGKDQTGTESA
ncbi:ATP-binding protein [Spirosoma endophyticum]|uniref:histidine kinase n=1 Tax=Spirosoma endophyticum TaxID=662367 RepID=A0A1I2G864_9BACT|nr:ATP-binding protein [Spirosoma endophyticum]SFF13722.1 PAS domain S-box-containing protein [Spirosoma endophyticum]